MLRGWLAGGFALLILCAAFWVRPPHPPASNDRPIALRLPQNRPLRITLLGTSLTHDEIWTSALQHRLEKSLGHPVQIHVTAKPGAGSDWGLSQVRPVAESAPDWVLLEFAINDADIRDGQNLQQARDTHVALIQGLQAAIPEVRILVLTMSPAQGLRGLLRPYLRAHYLQYLELAETLHLGAVDLYPRWLALPRAARGLREDGLHPEPQIAADLIVPALTDYLLHNLERAPAP